MKQKILIGAVFLLALGLLAIPGLAKEVPRGYGCNNVMGECTCDVRIKSVNYDSDLEAGERTTATVVYELTAGAGDTCDFLLESAILPNPSALSIIQATGPICCPGNTNYAATRVQVVGGWYTPLAQEHTVIFTLYAPTPNSQDACYTAGRRSYWAGTGYKYRLLVSAFNGCWVEVGDENFVVLAWDDTRGLSISYAETCGNGICEWGETKVTCPEDCVVSCGQPGCQNTEEEKMYCPDQCDFPPCNPQTCQGPFFQCVGSSCQPNWNLIIGIVVAIAIIGGVAYYLKR